MKWPETLTLVRHDTSAYNILRDVKATHTGYQEFKTRFEADPASAETIALIEGIRGELSLGVSDQDTPLAEGAGHQAEDMGGKLKDRIELPDVVFVSPYVRTRETLRRMTLGWPELAGVKTHEEERIAEQDHGLQAEYNDWRIFAALHPDEQALKKKRGPYWYRYPGGENIPDVKERLRSWLTTLTRDFAEKKVLAVTHHLAILSLRAVLERWSAEEFVGMDQKDKPINAGVTIYKGNPDEGADGHLELEVYNARLY